MSSTPPADTVPRADALEIAVAVASSAAGSEAGASTTHRVMRGALLLLSTQPITWACSLAMTIFVPRLLDSRSLGEYSVAVTLSGLLGAVVSLGVPTVLTRRIASQPESARTDITTALTLLVGLVMLVAALGLIVVPATGLLAISTPLL